MIKLALYAIIGAVSSSRIMQLSRTAKLLSAIISLLSFPTAYAFGLTFPFLGSGVSIFVDADFISGEVSRLLLCAIGFIAIHRVALNISAEWLVSAHKWSAEKGAVRWRRRVFFLFVTVSAVPLIATGALLFLDRSVIWGFIVSSAILLIFTCAVCQMALGELAEHQEITAQSLLHLFWDPRLNQGIVAILLILAVNLGYHRVISLSVSDKVCVITREGNLRVSLIGSTQRGILVSDAESEDWIAFTLPLGIAVIRHSVFAYISHDSIVAVDHACGPLAKVTANAATQAAR